MSIIKRNENETLYVGGKKHWSDVIKNSGSAEAILWRQPEEDFNTNSTLIVMPGEEAIFVHNGIIEACFSESGRYTLENENYPFLSRLKCQFTGGISTYNCVVYFVRKTVSMEIFWGTENKIQLRDKKLGIATEISCRGSYKIKVKQPDVFLSELIGNNVSIVTKESLVQYFRLEFQSKITSLLARAIEASDNEILGLSMYLDEFSEIITPYLEKILEPYGLGLVNFSIAALNVENDPLRRRLDEIGVKKLDIIRTAEAEGEAKKINAIAEKESMAIMGEDWKRSVSADILKKIAENPNGGGTAAAVSGVGVGAAMGGVFGDMVKMMWSSENTAQQDFGTDFPEQQSTRFMQESVEAPEEKSVPNSKTLSQMMAELKEAFDNDFITQEEYNTMRENVKRKFMNLE